MYSHVVWELVGLGFAIVFTAEFFSWLLVYRNGGYARLSDALDKASKKLAAMKESKKDKKQQMEERRMKDLARDMSAIKSRAGMVMAATVLAGYYLISKLYTGRIVAKLPFHAPGILQRLTHSGIEGDDYTDCGAAFIVIMTVQALRSSSQKLLGLNNRTAAKLSSPESFITEKLEKTKTN